MSETKSTDQPGITLKSLALIFARIGTIGFGGGVGMLALIREEFVTRRKLLDDEELATAVAMGQMLPGPFVTNYAEFIGFKFHGIKGMVVAAVALLLPSFLLMCVAGFLYFRYGTMLVIEKIFRGIQPVVVAILAWATWSIGRINIKNWRSALIAVFAAVALFLKGDVLLVVLGCGLLGIVLTSGWSTNKNALKTILPYFFLTGKSAAPTVASLISRAGELALVFFKMGTVIFGGGFAAIPFLQQEVVVLRQWLTPKEFIDAVALGQMTPGPVAIMSAFIGYRVLGVPGALIATIGTFLPSALMLLALISGYNRIKDNPLVRAFLNGVLPAVCGMLFFSTVFLARNAITAPIPALVAVIALISLLRLRVEPLWLIVAGAILGVLLP